MTNEDTIATDVKYFIHTSRGSVNKDEASTCLEPKWEYDVTGWSHIK